MADKKDEKKGRVAPHLVEIDEKPARTRRSIYSDLVKQFAESKATDVKVEGAKPTAVVSLKKAIINYKFSDIMAAYTSSGEVYLEKKTTK